VTLTKVLKIYLAWIHPSTILLYFLFPPFLQQVIIFYLHTCIHSICAIFILLHNFLTTSSLSFLPILLSRTCFALISFFNWIIWRFASELLTYLE
jgi:hypothetical protein